jgi:isopenicillin N synthase-like dioxygenase
VTLPPLADRIVGEGRMTRERYSIVYFVSADPDAVVECLPACVDEQHPAKYEPITQRAYCQVRSKVQYRDT